VLRATRKVLKPGGRTAFFTIYVPNDVPRPAKRRALNAAPKYGWSRAEHTQLMRSAGFVDIDEADYTEQYHETLRGWHDHSAERSAELVALWGCQLFADRQADRRSAIDAVEAGWQRRILISATRPHVRRSR
jgi:cyclopropane fatty-acyl-phospholipid synthase-like methyltransferase